MAEKPTAADLDRLWQEMLPEPGARAYANEHLRMLVLSTGKTAENTDYYAYVALSPANYLEMLKAELSGEPLVLSDFGEVVRAGEGAEPPRDVAAYMAEEYGANPNFTSDFAELVQKAAAGPEKK